MIQATDESLVEAFVEPGAVPNLSSAVDFELAINEMSATFLAELSGEADGGGDTQRFKPSADSHFDETAYRAAIRDSDANHLTFRTGQMSGLFTMGHWFSSCLQNKA